MTPTWKIKNIHVEIVLVLKKVHSWEGVTETVHGSFLSVLRVYSFVSFAPAGVHDLWSYLLRRYTKIALCWELSGMGSEFLRLEAFSELFLDICFLEG